MFHFTYFLSLCLTYAHLRHCVRSNNIAGVNQAWQFAWVLFRATNKVLYARLSLYVQHILKHAHSSIQAALNHRLVTLRGETNRFFAADLLTEKVNRFGRYVRGGYGRNLFIIVFRMHVKHVTENSIDKFYKNFNLDAFVNQQLRTSLQMLDTRHPHEIDVATTVESIRHNISQFLGSKVHMRKSNVWRVDFNKKDLVIEDTVYARITKAYEDQDEWSEQNKSRIVDLQSPIYGGPSICLSFLGTSFPYQNLVQFQ